ncbi:MAG TPA: VOC family protein [Chthoniobacterales bacterium]
MKNNALNWFEIFVEDFDRAKRFYETILNAQLQDTDFQGGNMAIFPYDSDNGTGGSLAKMEGNAPGPGGTIVYLNVEGDLDGVLERIPAAGGKVLRGRFDIAPHGFIGVFQDSEGNVVGLHSMS